jgi:hypothetical protein
LAVFLFIRSLSVALIQSPTLPVKEMRKKATKSTSRKPVKKSSNPKIKSKKPQGLCDLISRAMVSGSRPLPVKMDSTSVLEISLMLNDKFAAEVFKDAKKIFNIGKLQKLKKRKFESYLEEGVRQILGLWRCHESFTVHSDLFKTTFLISIGQILNDIEESHENKSAYMKWLRDNFGHKHLRYFQHAKQLANMGAFARNYAGLGKNRLLELERTRKELDKSFYGLLTQFPFEDTTEDHDGTLFKEHVDGIITYHRLKNAGVSNVEFDQAALIGAQLNGAITKKMASDISNWLNGKRYKSKALDDLILNKMSYPDKDATHSSSQPSLIRHLSDIILYSESINYQNNDDWVALIKDQVDKGDLKKVHDFIQTIAEKLGIELGRTRTRSRKRKAA